jgi:hypothetical protein
MKDSKMDTLLEIEERNEEQIELDNMHEVDDYMHKLEL